VAAMFVPTSPPPTTMTRIGARVYGR
jgi:hypothetical protein